MASCFRDRVMHHALMAYMGPVLERPLVACLVGKGILAAALRAQHRLRRHGPTRTWTARKGCGPRWHRRQC